MIPFFLFFERRKPFGGFLGRLLGHLKPSWGGLGASCRHVVSYLELCLAILSDLGGHFGISEALLEPSWAILGALTARGPPFQAKGKEEGEG